MKVFYIFGRILTALIDTAVSIILIIGAIYLVTSGQLSEMTCSVTRGLETVYEKLGCNNNTLNFGSSSTGAAQQSIVTQQTDSNNVEQVVNSVLPGVVTIVGTEKQNLRDYIHNGGVVSTSVGSGFVIRSDGWIATNAHVVADKNFEYKVILNGDRNEADVLDIRRDSSKDVAFIRIDRNNLHVLNLGDSNKVTAGLGVIAIGSPYGERNTVTTGNVINTNSRVMTNSEGQQTTFKNIIETNVKISPGNSGGPLLNQQGEVVGINFASAADQPNTAFAIPINLVKTGLGQI